MKEEEMYAIIKTRFEATHSWEGCDMDEVDFLANEHHHIFRVEARIPQKHDNRDVEYLNAKHTLDHWMEKQIVDENMSCEQYAKKIRTFLIKVTGRENVEVEVREDNGCGALVR